eukprot:TRINITY_DN10785_c0_g2_i1.p2 TRINITY_DN10785_c0_g2~~TRINITY_DN10785_c0_g2_i1.p2  ORF type:complete len:113 (-),score=20.58 TRINITY_DN10785_c0_g2_i1:167-505(-)
MIRQLAKRSIVVARSFSFRDDILRKLSYANEIIPRLYLGSAKLAFNKDLLEEYNITHIVNCAMEIRPRFPEDFKYLNIAMHNELGKDAFPLFDSAAEFIDEGTKEGNVYVHW